MEYKYIKEIFERADLQQIREYLLGDTSVLERDTRTYEERLKQNCTPIIKRIEKISKDDQELDELFSEYSNAEEAHKDVFLEIGMKVGARLMFQLLCEN